MNVPRPPASLRGRTYLAAIAICLALATVLFSDRLAIVLHNSTESILFAVDPSAERAYRYGNHHFDATANTYAYDIDRATFYFERALELDPSLPYIHHQMARVYFLKG